MGILEKGLGRLGFVKKGAGDSVWHAYLGEPGAKARVPKWSLVSAYDILERSWVFQAAIQLYITEVLRPGWTLMFRFKKKCLDCGAEFQKDIDTCEYCGSNNFRTPVPSEMTRARALFDEPNESRQSWNQILRSLLYHDAVADRWYLSVGYAPILTDTETPGNFSPNEIYVEDPRWIRTIYDERLRLGDKPYICKHHYLGEDAEENLSEIQAACPVCGLPMAKTCYVQMVNEEVENRFTRDEMIEGSTYQVLPDPDSLPRMVGAWQSLQTIKAMDEHFYDAYVKGQLRFMLVFPSTDQNDLSEYAVGLKVAQKKQEAIDAVTGDARPDKSPKHLWISSNEPVQKFDFMNDSVSMQALEHYLTHVSAVLAVIGIQAIYVNAEITGKTGGAPAVKMEIQNHRIEAIQHDKEDAINKHLLPMFGVHDVVFKFNPLVKKDMVNETKVLLQRAQAIATLSNVPGLTIQVDETGEIIYSGTVVGEREQQRPIGTTPQGQRESDESTALVNETTVSRKPLSTEDDNRVS